MNDSVLTCTTPTDGGQVTSPAAAIVRLGGAGRCGSTRCYNASAVGKKLTVILGAGASHDLVSTPVTRVNNQFQPPLAADLFKFQEPFATILDKYPRARALTATIATKVARGESPEAVLRAVRDSGHQHLVRQFRHLPLYLQELFRTISDNYTTEPATTLT